ncbi:uncharacterized protein LOC135479341 [Liolophura sinensis]|uniref:uncharacterized protein LOC135479341 n=1 Tax=Liolophura sinensis TaxID=3198878 RepID=UPI0031586750
MAEGSGDNIDPRRILVKNLPSGSSEELITNYLEVVTNLGVTDLDFKPELLSSISLVKFDEEFTDEAYKLAVQKTSQKLLTGQHVVIQRVAMATRVLLHDVPLPQTTEEYLQLYFEKLLHPVDGNIRKVALYSDIQKAVIMFSPPDVVEYILKQKIEISKTKVKAELYFPEFHLPILNSQLEEQRNRHAAEVSDVNLEMDTLHEAKHTEVDVNPGPLEGEERQTSSTNTVRRLTHHFEKVAQSPPRGDEPTSPTRQRSVEKLEGKIVNEKQSCDSTAPDAAVESARFSSDRIERPAGGKQVIVDLSHFIPSPRKEKTMENVPRVVGNPPTVASRPRKDSRGSCQGGGQTEYSLSPMSASKSFHHLPDQETLTVTEECPSERQSAHGYLSLRQPVSEEGRVESSSRRNLMPHSESGFLHGQTTERWQEERNVTIHDLNMPNNRHVPRVTSESNMLGGHAKPAGQRRIVDNPEDSEERCLRERENCTAEMQTPLDVAPVVFKEMTIDRLKLELLSQIEGLKNLACRVVTNEETGTLCFEGTEAQIRSSRLQVYELTNNMEEISISLPHSSMLEIIRHESSSLQSVLKKHRAVISVKKDQVSIVGLSKKEMKQAESALLKMVISDSLTLDPSYMTFTQSEEWRTFVQKKQSSGLVRIITALEKKTVYVNGMTKEVSSVKKEIMSTLKQNATVVKTIKVNNPKGKFINYHCKYQLSQINDKLRSKKVDVRVKICGRDFTEVESRGLKDVVDDGVKEVKSLEQSLAEFTVKIPFSVTKTKLWRTFSTGKEFNTWIEGLEKRYKCCIQPFLSKTRPPPKLKKSIKSPGREGRGYTKDSGSQRDRRNPQHDRPQSPDSNGSAMVPVTQQCGQLKIILKTGDITQERADVLVNGISSSLDLTQGQVAKKFLQKAGPQMQQDLSMLDLSGSAGEVAETAGGGQLQCKAVMHVVLERYKDASSLQALRDGVRECLKKSSGHTSLSLPTLGCGHLRYPNAPTAKAIVDEINLFGQSATSSLQVVTIVVFDHTLFPVFRGEIQPSMFSSLGRLSRMFVPEFSSQESVRPKRRFDSNKGYRRPRRSRRERESQGDMTFDPVKITVQNTTVIIKQGNIVKEDADVLVNVTNRDLDLSRGKVSQSFLKAGGEELQDEVSLSGKAKDGDVVVVPSCGSLQRNSKHIANVVLPRYKPQYGLQAIEKVIKGCLEKAVRHDVKSVAFPSLGCGRLSYPRDQVAHAMMKEIQNFTQNSSALKTIKIVIYEADVFAVFAETFKADEQDVSDDSEEESDEGEVNDYEDNMIVVSDDEEDGEDVEEDDEDEEEEIVGATASASGPKSAALNHQSKQSHFVVVTLSESVKDTKEHLETDIGNRFFATPSIQPDQYRDAPFSLDNKRAPKKRLVKRPQTSEIRREHAIDMHNAGMSVTTVLAHCSVSYSTISRLRICFKRLGALLTVHVAEDQNKALSLEVQGPLRDVSKASRKMTEILTEKNNNFDTGQHVKKNGTFEDWCEYQKRRSCDLPDYWDDATLSRWGAIKAVVTDNVLAKPSPSVETTIRNMITSTWQARYVGHGRDSHNIAPGMSMKITKIELIQNEQLFQKYFSCRQLLFMKVMKKDILPLGKIKTQPDILTNKYLTRDFTRSFEKDVNEVYLFHGTPEKGVKGICRNGIDFRLASEGGMLGRGIYCAESSTKADQYAGITDASKNRVHKDLKMLVVRVALGKIYLCEDQNPKKFSRPPCVRCFQEKCEHPDGLFDSVVYSNPQKNFREFVVYANEQCYPEFIITYDRV